MRREGEPTDVLLIRNIYRPLRAMTASILLQMAQGSFDSPPDLLQGPMYEQAAHPVIHPLWLHWSRGRHCRYLLAGSPSARSRAPRTETEPCTPRYPDQRRNKKRESDSGIS